MDTGGGTIGFFFLNELINILGGGGGVLSLN